MTACEYFGAAEPRIRCGGMSHLSGTAEPSFSVTYEDSGAPEKSDIPKWSLPYQKKALSQTIKVTRRVVETDPDPDLDPRRH